MAKLFLYIKHKIQQNKQTENKRKKTKSFVGQFLLCLSFQLMLIYRNFNNKWVQAPSTHCDNQANIACFYDFSTDLVNEKLTETVLHQKHVHIFVYAHLSELSEHFMLWREKSFAYNSCFGLCRFLDSPELSSRNKIW